MPLLVRLNAVAADDGDHDFLLCAEAVQIARRRTPVEVLTPCGVGATPI